MTRIISSASVMTSPLNAPELLAGHSLQFSPYDQPDEFNADCMRLGKRMQSFWFNLQSCLISGKSLGHKFEFIRQSWELFKNLSC